MLTLFLSKRPGTGTWRYHVSVWSMSWTNRALFDRKTKVTMNPKPFVQNNYNIASLQHERLVVLLVPVILCRKYCNIHAVAWVYNRAVNTSDFRSGSPGFKPHPSGCFLRQGTLLHFVSLHQLSPRCINGYWRQASRPGGCSNTPTQASC